MPETKSATTLALWFSIGLRLVSADCEVIGMAHGLAAAASKGVCSGSQFGGQLRHGQLEAQIAQLEEALR